MKLTRIIAALTALAGLALASCASHQHAPAPIAPPTMVVPGK
ncbi:MAG: hypothetical protein P8M65_02210 [Roseibacillus sp.]|nr:hypothetical protein [Roseibacillus sp.]